jgi:GST-like protein
VGRLYRVLNDRLSHNRYVAGDFLSIADFAIFPWAVIWEGQQQSLDDKPHLARYLDELAARPAFAKGRSIHLEVHANLQQDREAQKILFGKQR